MTAGTDQVDLAYSLPKNLTVVIHNIDESRNAAAIEHLYSWTFLE
jgi:hypothetical protein